MATINKFGLYTISTNEALDIIIDGGSLNGTIYENDKEKESLQTYTELFDMPEFTFEKQSQYSTVEEFDTATQTNWFIPSKYKNIDIVEFILSKCTTQQEIDRVNTELEYFIKEDSLIILNYMHYLVDTMRKNNIIWGVGRGSSVSLYCLYLLGVHRVNSIKYDLDITEFFK